MGRSRTLSQSNVMRLVVAMVVMVMPMMVKTPGRMRLMLKTPGRSGTRYEEEHKHGYIDGRSHHTSLESLR